jgi:salicylate hydroxylase
VKAEASAAARDVTDTGRILIAGGGIGGLTFAVALAARGVASTILERAATFSETGAGIQLGPNAVMVLTDLGVAERLASQAGKPDAIVVHDGPSGARLARLPLGDWIVRRHGAPYWVAHRANLQSALVEAARSTGLIEIVMAARLARIEIGEERVRVHCRNGFAAAAPVLVGADGLWSTVRGHVCPTATLVFSGKTAARALVPRAGVPPPLGENVVGAWLAPQAHVVHYPVRGGQEIALVVVAEAPNPGKGFGVSVDPATVLRRVSIFDHAVRSLLERAERWQTWALYDPVPLVRWSHERVTLLGDAAHPILPFLAQGGAMAIEDAAVLANALAAHPQNAVRALRQYEQARRPRVARVQVAARRNGRIYHLSEPMARARNLALRILPGERLMAAYDWLYGWTSEH